MKKISNFIFEHLVAKHKVEHCFFIPGGGAMHLNDALGHTPGLSYICNHHEQACAIAQEGYYRASGKMCVTNVTTGPGGTNALTGVLGQWLDSIPAFYISGQIKASTHMSVCPELKLRQLGDQESDIIGMVKPITKYAVTVFDPMMIKYEIDKAMYIAQSGRPGPVWLDIPLNVQGAIVDETQMKEFDPSEIEDTIDHDKIDEQIIELLSKVKDSKAPLIYVGNGVRLAEGVPGEQILGKFEERSRRIQQEGYIKEEYERFADKYRQFYLSRLHGRKMKTKWFRGLNRLLFRRLEPLVLNKSYMEQEKLELQNYIECEAHRELLIAGMKHREKIKNG